jgi:signal transduction histidine kinase/ligand-binding sensor domain-containing protein
MGKVSKRAIVGLAILLARCACAFGLDPSLDVSQYAHTAWTIREGFFRGNIYSIAQTGDGYLWLGTEFGLLRFDGNRYVPWQPPAGQKLPGDGITKLLVTSDGTLWIGTYAGLVSWSGGKLTRYPELDNKFVASMLQDREGTVWVGTLGSPFGRLCSIKNGGTQCDGQDGALGRMVASLYEDSTGALWAAAQSGLWRWRPGLPTHYAIPTTELKDLNSDDQGELLIATGDGTRQFAHGKSEAYAIPGGKPVGTNRLLRDRDGGLWIGTIEQGLIHVHHGRTDVFSKSDGLSGDVIFSLFEDREGSIWVSTNGGLDRFRDFSVSTISVKQGLLNDSPWSILAARDGTIWVGSGDGLNTWKNGQITTIRKAGGQSDDAPQSLFQDDRGRIWAFTSRGLDYVEGSRFVSVTTAQAAQVHSITGDGAGNLWLSENTSLLHLREGRVVEEFRWPQIGRQESASVLLSDREHGLWLGFWRGGGVSYFKDGQVRASYTAANGLTPNAVSDLQLDHTGALWVATQDGLNRIKDGRIATLTSRNGLPCNTVHWTMEDDDHTLWAYTACGMVRIAPTELDAWIADPKRTIEATVWDAADGVRLRSTAASFYGPRAAKSTDGKLWFVTGEGIQVIDPRHLPFNKLPPPIRIEQITADHKIRWQNILSEAPSNLRLPQLTRDLQIEYTALSLVEPEKIHFKYRLEGYDRDWQDVGNRRQAFYTNLAPAHYRFRVIASNNSGVWNEEGATLEFSIAPAYYQTNWFRALCGLAFVGMFWIVYHLRVNALKRRHAVLEQQQALLERHQTEVRALNEQMIKAQEAERMRISGELHDGVLQQITSLTLRLGKVRNQVSPDSEAKATVSGLQQELIKIGTDIRHISHELHPALLQESGLPAALSSYCEEFSKVRGLTVTCETDASVEELSPGAALCLYRIAQEALGNAAKYSEAKKVEVRLTRSNGTVCLCVSDDGVGCTPDELRRSGGLGVINMRERVLQLRGTFEFKSEAARGTIVKAEVPFRPAS